MDVSRISIGQDAMSDHEARYVDMHRAELIQRVQRVMVVTRKLLSKGRINVETYSQIMRAGNKQDRMRKLYEALDKGGDQIKSAFYLALLKCESNLTFLGFPYIDDICLKSKDPFLKKAQFVDKHKSELIQRVTMVMPVMDDLLAQHKLNDQRYARIRRAQTNPEQMTELFTALDEGGNEVKSAFYFALRKHEPHLFCYLGHNHEILQYKSSVVDKYSFVTEYNISSDECLAVHYTEPVIIQKSKEQSEKYYREHVRSVDTLSPLFSNDRNQRVRIDQLFSPDSDGNAPKTVILSGDSGRGKSFMLQKIMLDWASGELYSENFDVIYLLKSDEVKCLSQMMSLNDLLDYNYSLTYEFSEILELTPEKVLFLIDGIDEFSFDPHIQISSPSNLLEEVLPMDILRSLLNGQFLPESFLLVTTRSASGAVMNILKCPQRFTELMGFSENGVQEYFQKFFQDELLFRKTYERVKTKNKSLLTACSVPLLCWMVCFCLKKHFTDDDQLMRELKTTTSIYVHFVSTLLEHHGHSHGPSQSILRSLGQLAEEGMLDEEVLFDKKTVLKTGLDADNSPFLHKELRIVDLLRKRELNFMHLSFQEFFMALYYVILNEEESQRNIRDTLAAESVKGRLSNSIASVLLFLCGLSNEDTSSLLFKRHNITVPYIIRKEMESTILALQDEDKLFAFHCLYELHDEEFVRRALVDWISMDLSNVSLKSTDCWVLLYCLQCCPHVRYLNLMNCDLTAEKLKILQPAICMCETLRLSVDHLPEVGDLISTLCGFKKLLEMKVQEDEYSGKSPRWSLNLSVAQEDYRMSLSSSEKNPSFPAVLNMSFTCSQSEISSTDWTLFLQRLSKAGHLAEHSSAVDEHVSLLLSSFYFGGLKKLNLNVVGLNESWASGIISLVQTCTSLQELIIEEDRNNPMSFFSTFIVLVYNEDIRLDLRHRWKSESLSKISLTCPRSALSISDWKILFQRFHEVSRYQRNSPECNEQVEALFSFLHSVCDLKSVELIIFSLNQSWAFRILTLIQACSSLQKICVSVTGFLLEVGLKLLYESLTESHCTVIIEGPSIFDSEPSGLNLHPLCQSCVHIVDFDQWVQVEPSVCTDEGGSEFRISTPSGRFECSRTRLRWVCAGDVTFQYRAVDGGFLSEELERLQCERIGPVFDVTVISGKLEEAHLPHYACLAESDPSLGDAVKVLSVEDEGISLESVELTRFHAKILEPSFSPKTVLMKLGIAVKVHCDLLIFMTHKNPIILHAYFFPSDSRFKEKIKLEEKSSQPIKCPRPEIPLRMMKQHSLEVPGASVQPKEIKLRGDIDPNFFKVKHPVVNDIKMSLNRVDDQKTIWTTTIWKEELAETIRSKDESNLFQHGEKQTKPQVSVNFDKVRFFDRNWCALIKSVRNVNTIADKLLQKRLINEEMYSKITHPTLTKEESMREICSIVRKRSVHEKNLFISVIQEEEPSLLNQGCPSLFLEDQYPAEFSSQP